MYKYKCTECGQEYNELQEYCDCGNDSFDVIETQGQPQSIVQNQYDKKNNDYEPQYTAQKISDYRRRLDLPSITFLLVCIIISAIILFFPVNSSDKNKDKTAEAEKSQQSVTKKVNRNIPSIDELWIANKPAASTSAPAKQKKEPVNQPVQSVEKAITSLFNREAKIPQTAHTSSYTPAPVTSSVPKTQPARKTTSSSSYTPSKKATPRATPKKTTQTSQKTVKKQTEQKQNTAPKKTTTTAATTTVFQPAQQSTQKQTRTNTAAQKQALLNYKIALRNKIVSNINFGTIVGDGSCVITFKISSSGQLVSRAFAKQSTNDSLNEAVYNGVMQTPAYNPPPSGYKNETLKLSVTMYGGNFEVDLN